MFNSIDDFYNQVEIGQEFTFLYKNTEYDLSQDEHRIYIINCDTREEYTFRNAKEVITSFEINGIPLGDLISEIKE